jgi:hypothetical protein
MLDTAAIDFLVFRYVGIQRPPPFPAMSTGSLNWGSFHLTDHQPQLDIIAQLALNSFDSSKPPFFLSFVPSTIYCCYHTMCTQRKKNCVCGHVKRVGGVRLCENAPYVDGRRVPCGIRTTLTSGSSDLCGSRTCRMTQMHGLWTCCQCRTRNEMQFWCNNDECNHGFCRNCTATPQRRRRWKSSIP